MKTVSKPQAWLRCEHCYGTGYKVVTITGHETALGKISNKHCEICKGSGFLPF